MINATKSYFTNYVNFKGRTSRADYWWTMLGIFLLTFIIAFIAGLIFGIPEVPTSYATPQEAIEFLKSYFTHGYVVVLMIWSLVLILPSLAICVRRLHDINKSGWWYLLNLVPYVGGIVLFIFYLLPSVKEGNRF